MIESEIKKRERERILKKNSKPIEITFKRGEILVKFKFELIAKS